MISPIDVDAHDLATSQEIADGSQEQGASPEIRPGLDDQLRADLVQDLLVVPEVKWALEYPVSEPERVPPRLFVAAVVEGVELVNERRSVRGSHGFLCTRVPQGLLPLICTCTWQP